MVDHNSEVMRHVGLELAGLSRMYSDRAFDEEASGGMNADLVSAHYRRISETYHALETWLAERLARQLEEKA